MDHRFALDVDLFPNRVMVGSETVPPAIDTGWAAVRRHPQVIGDFTWTGWDYLGEVGIGRTEDGEGTTDRESMQYAGSYPWIAAWCGDIDITGRRRPQSYYREIVFGRRSDPYIAMRRPERHGQKVLFVTSWSWSDTVGSWSFAGHEGSPVVVEVYADADEVELSLSGESLGRRSAGGLHVGCVGSLTRCPLARQRAAPSE